MPSVYCKIPFSSLKITQRDGSLCELGFVNSSGSSERGKMLTTQDVLLTEVLKQLDQYLQNPAFIFNLPLALQGTDFQRKVWAALQRIPAGEVRTYGEVAAELHSSARAVGNACRKNPVPVIVPCHRIVSAQGIGGFSGQTEGNKISIKRQLLSHEGVEF